MVSGNIKVGDLVKKTKPLEGWPSKYDYNLEILKHDPATTRVRVLDGPAKNDKVYLYSKYLKTHFEIVEKYHDTEWV